MSLSGTSDLYIVELVLYLLLFPLTVYLSYRHGWAGALGYFYLTASCGVRIAADIVSLLPANRDATHPTIATAVLSTIGLSPLLLALSGFLHEAHVRMFDVTHGLRQAKTAKRWMWAAQFQIHTIAILGIVLAIIGNVKLASADTLDSSEVSNYLRLRSAGAVIIFIVWACLALYALYLGYVVTKVHASSHGSIDLQAMIRWILYAMPFAGLRCVSTIVYTFDHKNSTLNPVTGATWVKVVFVVLATLGAVIGMCASGWVSRDLPRDVAASTAYRKASSSDDGRHEPMAFTKQRAGSPRIVEANV